MAPDSWRWPSASSARPGGGRRRRRPAQRSQHHRPAGGRRPSSSSGLDHQPPEQRSRHRRGRSGMAGGSTLGRPPPCKPGVTFRSRNFHSRVRAQLQGSGHHVDVLKCQPLQDHLRPSGRCGARIGGRRLERLGPFAHPLHRRSNGTRSVSVQLTPGPHAFRYLADGGVWLDEPDAVVEPDGYGTTHSVLVIA